MRLALDAVAEGRAQAAVSAGNTGALMGMAHFVLGTLPGISRPAILAALPAPHGCTWALDLGANATATPEQLRQFAVMGHLVAREVGGLEQPRVGLLNIGAEELKGNDTVQAAHALLRATPGLNYLGFVEGNAFFSGEVDVVVTDGFSGRSLKTQPATTQRRAPPWLSARSSRIFEQTLGETPSPSEPAGQRSAAARSASGRALCSSPNMQFKMIQE